MAVLYDINGKTLLFIHIPKTGGGSVQNALSTYRRRETPIPRGHPGIYECNMVVKADYVFSVVRNPWDWRASWYHYLKQGESGHIYEYNIVKNMSFKEHLIWLNNEPLVNLTNSIHMGVDSRLFIKQQSEYINSDVKILRFENLKVDFENYMMELGLDIKLDNRIRINKSSNNDYINEYDSDSIEIVRKMHSDDIIKFGYDLK